MGEEENEVYTGSKGQKGERALKIYFAGFEKGGMSWESRNAVDP